MDIVYVPLTLNESQHFPNVSQNTHTIKGLFDMVVLE